MIQLVAFLGNYGREYENTRHNAGWIFERNLSFASKLNFQNKYKAEFCAVDYETVVKWLCDAGLAKLRSDGSLPIPDGAPSKLYFMKPLTYMNLSGDAIGEAARFFKIPASDVLVVHDEVELPFGTCGFKFSGGLAGHNGLRSTKNVLGTPDFFRLRIGIGKPSNGDVAGFALSSFTQDEFIGLSQVFVTLNQWFAKILLNKAPESLTQGWNKKNLLS